jgi:hypothetical protein
MRKWEGGFKALCYLWESLEMFQLKLISSTYFNSGVRLVELLISVVLSVVVDSSNILAICWNRRLPVVEVWLNEK